MPFSEMRKVEIGGRKTGFPARPGLAGGHRGHGLTTAEAAPTLQGAAVVHRSTFCCLETHRGQGALLHGGEGPAQCP